LFNKVNIKAEKLDLIFSEKKLDINIKLNNRRESKFIEVDKNNQNLFISF
tara:strand:+ start:156 stop:305 length:150 start_codon:yes stop_codon:yes gene_type:complete